MRNFVAIALVVTSLGCSRNNIEAVNLANEGDKLKNGNIDEAISKYEQATRLDPTNHRILYKLILAYRKKEDWPKVASTAAQAEKAAPTFANYYFEHGYALEQQAKKGPTGWSEAKQPFQEAIQKDPRMSDAYHELGEVLLHLDDEQGALQNYTKAIETKPDEASYYGPLADLYMRLGYQEQAEQVVKEGLAFAKEGDKHLFTLHTLMGAIKEAKGDIPGSVPEYEAARKSCGNCGEPGQQIAFFNLGAAYAQLNPPRKNEAMQQLQAFQKVICKGAAAARYADQCAQAQQFATKLGGVLQ
jgi:tetratricopeptide (TPR) repeat protein